MEARSYTSVTEDKGYPGVHGQLVLEQEARELEVEEVSTGGKNKKRK